MCWKPGCCSVLFMWFVLSKCSVCDTSQLPRLAFPSKRGNKRTRWQNSLLRRRWVVDSVSVLEAVPTALTEREERRFLRLCVCRKQTNVLADNSRVTGPHFTSSPEVNRSHASHRSPHSSEILQRGEPQWNRIVYAEGLLCFLSSHQPRPVKHLQMEVVSAITS